jgi:hypothetical protein
MEPPKRRSSTRITPDQSESHDVLAPYDQFSILAESVIMAARIEISVAAGEKRFLFKRSGSCFGEAVPVLRRRSGEVP